MNDCLFVCLFVCLFDDKFVKNDKDRCTHYFSHGGGLSDRHLVCMVIPSTAWCKETGRMVIGPQNVPAPFPGIGGNRIEKANGSNVPSCPVTNPSQRSKSNQIQRLCRPENRKSRETTLGDGAPRHVSRYVCVLVCLFVCLFVCMLVGWMVGWLVGCLVCLLVGWFVGLSVCWLEESLYSYAGGGFH